MAIVYRRLVERMPVFYFLLRVLVIVGHRIKALTQAQYGIMMIIYSPQLFPRRITPPNHLHPYHQTQPWMIPPREDVISHPSWEEALVAVMYPVRKLGHIVA